MHAKWDASEVIDYFGFIEPWVKPGDSVRLNNVIFTITQEGLDCDCNKGLWCPLIPQTVVKEK